LGSVNHRNAIRTASSFGEESLTDALVIRGIAAFEAVRLLVGSAIGGSSDR
jgi:hypothetical protein